MAWFSYLVAICIKFLKFTPLCLVLAWGRKRRIESGKGTMELKNFEKPCRRQRVPNLSLSLTMCPLSISINGHVLLKFLMTKS